MSPQRARKDVWYTGENRRPPLEGFDLSYSFDYDSYGGTNVYLPLILTGLDWFVDGQAANSLEGKRAGKTITPSIAWKPQKTNVAERMEFACAFIGNPEPTRLRAIQELSKIGQVDVYGAAVNRPVRDKFSVARRYRYMLCFENDLYPGYITEKPLDAWISGCIPLWRGIDSAGLLNTKSHVNEFNHDSLSSFAEEVYELDLDPTRVSKMGAEPLLAEEPSLEAASKALRNFFN
jgi:hypothetical protein